MLRYIGLWGFGFDRRLWQNPTSTLFLMLHTLRPAHGSRQKKKRVGRGASAGQGTTAGRGTKGQQSRTGKGRKFGFEGGQTPLLRRQPKLGGFTPPRQVKYEVLNIGTLEAMLPAGSYDRAALKAAKLLTKNLPVKLLGEGELKKSFKLSVQAASKSAKKAVEAAGGSVTVVPA
jgi:large subunit ribosomal protein L15